MRRTKEEAEQTKRELRQAALVVFSRDGFAGARLADIASEAGVTRGAIYHHFDNKAELYRELVIQAEAEQQALMQAAIQEGGGIADITRRILEQSLAALSDRPTYRQVMELTLFKVADSEELGGLIEKRQQEAVTLIDSIAQILEQGQQNGEFRSDLDPNNGARAFIGYQQGLARLWLANPGAFDIGKEAKVLADHYMRGLLG